MCFVRSPHKADINPPIWWSCSVKWELLKFAPDPTSIETVAPLAAALGLEIIVDERLAEGPAHGAIALARALAETSTVFCSHGDILPAILDHLRLNDALDLGPDPRCQKGSTWICEPNKSWAGHFAEATYLPPPLSWR
jgi:hypothetical protein